MNPPNYSHRDIDRSTGNTPNRTDVGDALAFAAAAREPFVLDLEHAGTIAPVLLIPGANSTEIRSVKSVIDEYRDTPERRRGTIKVDDLDSFIALVNRDKRPDSAIFARRKPARLVAVLDMHGPADSSPRHCEDRVSYDFPYSTEYDAWIAAQGEKNAMDQGKFAAFIEDRIGDIGTPGGEGAIATKYREMRRVSFADQSTMMSMAKGVEVRKGVITKEVRNIATGETSITILEGHETKDAAGVEVKIPAAFYISIPIWQGGEVYTFAVRLRYRAPEKGGTTWWFELHAVDAYLDAAMAEVIARLRGPAEAPADALATPDAKFKPGCALPVYLGSPHRSVRADD